MRRVTDQHRIELYEFRHPTAHVLDYVRWRCTCGAKGNHLLLRETDKAQRLGEQHVLRKRNAP